MFTCKNFIKVQSLEEAWTLNQKRNNKVGGGMLWLRMRRNPVMTLIDLSDLGLNEIEETNEEFRIGCMVTLRQLETHEGFLAYTGGAAREAVRHIIGVQFRNLATVGGSVFGRFGFSDVLTLFMAMDAYVELYKGGLIPIAQFAEMPYDRDILVRIIVKKEKAGYSYRSVRTNASTDFPALTASGALLSDGSVRLAIGARPQKAMLLQCPNSCLALKEGDGYEAYVQEVKERAAKEVKTMSNLRGSAAYRTHLVKVMTERILRDLNEMHTDKVNR